MNAGILLKALLRRLFLAAIVFGLVGGIGLWIASYCFDLGYCIVRSSSSRFVSFAAYNGSFRLLSFPRYSNTVDALASGWQTGAMNSEAVMWLGPHNMAPNTWWYDSTAWWFTFQFGWFVAPLSLILALYFLPAYRRRRRRRLGLCAFCGYDLRGLVDPRCPECGQEFERPSPPSEFSHT